MRWPLSGGFLWTTRTSGSKLIKRRLKLVQRAESGHHKSNTGKIVMAASPDVSKSVEIADISPNYLRELLDLARLLKELNCTPEDCAKAVKWRANGIQSQRRYRERHRQLVNERTKERHQRQKKLASVTST